MTRTLTNQLKSATLKSITSQQAWTGTWKWSTLKRIKTKRQHLLWGSNPPPCAPLMASDYSWLHSLPAFQRPGIVAERLNYSTGTLWRSPFCGLEWSRDQHPVLSFTQTAASHGLDYSTALPVPAGNWLLCLSLHTILKIEQIDFKHEAQFNVGSMLKGKSLW